MLLWAMIHVVDKILAVVVFIYSWDYIATNPIYSRNDHDTLLERLLVRLFSWTKSILPKSKPLRQQLYQKLYDFSTAVIINASQPEPCPDSASTDPKSQPHRLAIRCTSPPQLSSPAPAEPVARPRMEKHAPYTKRGRTAAARYKFLTPKPRFDMQNNINHFLATHGRAKFCPREPQIPKNHDQDKTRKSHTDDRPPAEQAHQTQVCPNTPKDQLQLQIPKNHDQDKTRKSHTDDQPPAEQALQPMVSSNTLKDQLERAASRSADARFLIHQLRISLAWQVPREQKKCPPRAQLVNTLAKLEAEVNQEEVHFMNAWTGLEDQPLLRKDALDRQRDEFAHHLQGYRHTLNTLIDTLQEAHGLQALRPTDRQRIYACGQQLWQIREDGTQDLWCEVPEQAPRHTDPATRLNGNGERTTATGGGANATTKARAKGRRCVRWQFDMEDAGSRG